MFRPIIAIIMGLALVLPALAQTSHAGSSEAANPQLAAADVAAFSNRVQRDLAARGARVAIVARMGRNPNTLPQGVEHTHVSFWVYSEITDVQGRKGTGFRVYNLYQDGMNSTRSSLVQDSPAAFFAGAYRFDAGVIIPDAETQTRLLQVIASPTYAKLHNPRYSVLSNPNSALFQNCTEHTLDVIMAAIYGLRDVAAIKARTAEVFTPQVIPVSDLKRALAGIVSGAMTTEDQGARIETAKCGSIARFLQKEKHAAHVYRITPDRVYRF